MTSWTSPFCKPSNKGLQMTRLALCTGPCCKLTRLQIQALPIEASELYEKHMKPARPVALRAPFTTPLCLSSLAGLREPPWTLKSRRGLKV